MTTFLFHKFQQLGSDSDLSLAGDVKGSKKDLKGRLSGMFKRGSSRSNSTEKMTPDSQHRPVSIASVSSVVSVGSSNGLDSIVPPPAPIPTKVRNHNKFASPSEIFVTYQVGYSNGNC